MNSKYPKSKYSEISSAYTDNEARAQKIDAWIGDADGEGSVIAQICLDTRKVFYTDLDARHDDWAQDEIEQAVAKLNPIIEEVTLMREFTQCLEVLIANNPYMTGRDLLTLQAQQIAEHKNFVDHQNKGNQAWCDEINKNGGYFRYNSSNEVVFDVDKFIAHDSHGNVSILYREEKDQTERNYSLIDPIDDNTKEINKEIWKSVEEKYQKSFKALFF